MINLKNLLFDTPIALRALLIIVGLALLITGNRRRQPGLMRAGFAVLGVFALLCTLSFFIETDQEKAIKRTKDLVTAVEKRDTATMADLLHPDVRLESWTKADIIEGTKVYADQMKLVSTRVNSVDAQQSDPDLVTVRLSVTAHLENGMFDNIPSSWSLQWVKTPQGWLVRDIRPLPAGPGQDSEELKSRFQQPPPR